MKPQSAMFLAEQTAGRSVCGRAKVGAVVVDAAGRSWAGFNHVADDVGACCEGVDGRTIDAVLHAEQVAIFAACADADDLFGAVLYVTRQPCLRCARLIALSGIDAVFYRDADDKTDGLELLQRRGVDVFYRWLTVHERVQMTWAERCQ